VLRGIRKGEEEMIARYPLTALLAVFQKICDGVAYAHSMGVVHRDLKPDNVMIGEYGEVLVMDWGLAKKIAHGLNEEHLGETAPKMPPPDLRGFETLNGLIVGTPPYIAPEAARGELEKIDACSDIYVLGAILYAILTLRPPFPGKEFAELIEQIVTGKFVHPSSYNQPVKASRNPEPPKPDAEGNLYVLSHLPAKRVPEGLAAVVMKAMSYAPADRYANVAELQADVTAWQGGFAPKAERAGLKRQVFLWTARHKGNVALVTLFAVIFHVSIIWFFLSLKHERDRALASEKQLFTAMHDLQGAAPLFAEEAAQLAKKKEYEAALDRIESAIRQVPNDPDYHTLRGNLLQVLLRWDEAIEAYETALERNPAHPDAKTNLELTRKVVEEMGDAPGPDAAHIRELQAGIAKQGRVGDASTLLEKSGMDRQAALRALREAIENDPQLAPLREVVRRREFRGRFAPQPDGSYTANFQKFPYVTLAPFFDAVPVQISGLVLDEVNIPDLSVLAGMRLRSLSLAGCRTVRNLQPLQELPELQRLNLARTNVTDLSPLAGLPLIELNLEDCSKLTDFRPLLECRQLESLVLPKGARDIDYLKEHKALKYLSYRRSNQPVAEFWAAYGSRK
jgi:tetratricopeptide (TPR) repeat protein